MAAEIADHLASLSFNPTHLYIHTCMMTKGCVNYNNKNGFETLAWFAGNVDNQGSQHEAAAAPRMFEAMSCSLRAVLEPNLVHRVTDELAAAAAGSTGKEFDGFVDPTPFAEALERASKWRVDVVEAAQEAKTSGDGLVVGYTPTPSAAHRVSSSSSGGASAASAELVANAFESLRRATRGDLLAGYGYRGAVLRPSRRRRGFIRVEERAPRGGGGDHEEAHRGCCFRHQRY